MSRFFDENNDELIEILIDNGFEFCEIEHLETLELAELVAKEYNCYVDEYAVSQLFDEHVLPGVIECFSEDDEVAINEEFSNWTDGLAQDGQLHPEQYSNYGYVGRLS